MICGRFIILEKPDSIVRFENVGLRYGLGPEVLRDISFDLAPGSFHFLVGEKYLDEPLMGLIRNPIQLDLAFFHALGYQPDFWTFFVGEFWMLLDVLKDFVLPL